MEYIVLTNDHIICLVEEVNKHLKEGWKPLGGINSCRDLVFGGNNEVTYSQALIK